MHKVYLYLGSQLFLIMKLLKQYFSTWFWNNNCFLQIEQKTTDTIEHVTEEILEFLIEDEEYLAVFFSGPCEDDDPCDDILEDLVSNTKI